MSDLKFNQKKVQLLDNLHISVDSIEYAACVFPLVENLIKSIAALKFEPSDESKKKYSESLKNLGSFVLDNYSKTLSLYRFSREISYFFKELVIYQTQREKEQKSIKTTQMQIHEICKRHYEPVLGGFKVVQT